MNDAPKTNRFKSPPYPSVPLQRAIERAGQLYQEERDHLVPLSSAARAWGMSPTSSGPVILVGALRQYGLLDSEGSSEQRRVKLTLDALRILMDKDVNSQARQETIRRCFLAPKIYAELWDLWKADLPSDQTILRYLVLDRKLNGQAPFSETAALELLANYRASLSFAGMSGNPTLSTSTQEVVDSVAPSELAEVAPEPPRHVPSRPESQPSARILERGRPMEQERVLSDGLLSKTATYRLIVSGPVGLKEIERLIKKLEIDKEILADDEDAENGQQTVQ